MSTHSKVFTYEVEGLSYTITVYEENGAFLADITVLDGAMDVNAIYFGDDDFSGRGESLSGPLNMNGARLDGERVQWDAATELSRPGLGSEGEDKETYLQTGDTLTVDLDIDSLDEIDVMGIRATSTTTEEGSIKGVSDEPEEPEEPEDPEEPTFEKVLFGTALDENGGIIDGVAIVDEPREGYETALPEGTEPTFENYLTHYEEEVPGYEIAALQSVVFYSFHEDGYPVELFRLEAPEDGFQDADDVLAAYDEALESGVLEEAGYDPEGGAELMAALSLEETPDDEGEPVAEDEVEEELDIV